MGYKWCPYLNMFCNDIEDEEIEMAHDINPDFDGDCRHCDEVIEISQYYN